MGRFVTGYGAQENGSDVTGLGVAGTMTGLQPIQQNFLPRNDIAQYFDAWITKQLPKKLPSKQIWFDTSAISAKWCTLVRRCMLIEYAYITNQNLGSHNFWRSR